MKSVLSLLVLVAATSVADAQFVTVCGPNGCRVVRAAAQAPVLRVQAVQVTAPVPSAPAEKDRVSDEDSGRLYKVVYYYTNGRVEERKVGPDGEVEGAPVAMPAAPLTLVEEAPAEPLVMTTFNTQVGLVNLGAGRLFGRADDGWWLGKLLGRQKPTWRCR